MINSPIPDTEWIRAVLRHARSTRHLHIDVVEDGALVRLEGSVPTPADRDRAGFIARHAATPGIRVVNHLFASDDSFGEAHAYAPRWQALYRASASALAA